MSEVKAGTRIGKYEVLERLGAGGMAEAFLARQPGMAGFSKKVVIKRLLPRFAKDERYVRLFIEEAKLAAQVQHKNVVQMFELGSEADASVFMAMEYVPGADLSSLLVQAGRQQQRFPVWLSLHIVCEVLEALSFAHNLTDDEGRARRVVHNDVSPENVIVARHGEVKLGDFGVAVDATREADPLPEIVVGKLSYMAPERVREGRASHASDLYAVGVVLWECLTQRRLFPSKDREAVTRRILEGHRRPPSHFAEQISSTLDEVVMSAIDPDPSRRPSTARDMQVELLAELSLLKPRFGLEDIRGAVSSMIVADEQARASPPRLEGSDELVSQPDFQYLLSDVIADVESRKGTLPDLRPEDLAPVRRPRGKPLPVPDFLAADTIPDGLVDTLPSPARGEHVSELDTPTIDLDDDPETTAVVRKRRQPRGQSRAPAGPTPAGPPPNRPPPSVWVRSRGGVQIGPRDPLEALGVLEELGSDDARRALEVTVDRVEWLPVLRLPVLLGEAHVSPDAALPSGELAGTFDTRSPTSVLAEVARSGASGRLVFLRYETTSAERTELQIEMGHVVAFGASRHLLPGWGGLLERPEAVAKDVVHALGQVIASRRPLRDVAQPATFAHLRDLRGLALEQAIEDLHGWPWGRYAFEPGGALTGGRVQPLPIFPRLSMWLEKSKSVPVLMAHLAGALDVPMSRAASFDREARELELSLEDQARLDRFGFARTLRDSFGASTSLRDERPSVRLGYLLREIGLLEPAPGAGHAAK